MKTPSYSRLASATLFLSVPLVGVGQTTWDYGASPDKNWSAFTNWSTDASPAATAVVFGTTGSTASNTTVTNIVDTDYTGAGSLTSLAYSGASTTNWQVTQINSPQTLTVTGNLTVGGLSGANTTQVAFTGAGSLVINNSASNVTVANTGSTSAKAILDMSALSTFSATVNAFNVGTGTTGYGTLYLADNSTITATTIKSGGTGASYGSGVSNKIFLGTTTVMNANTLSFGAERTYGQVKFRAVGDGAANNTTVASPTLKIRAADGTSAAAMSVGGWTGSSPASGTSSVDLTGGTVDAKVTTLKVGTTAANNNGNTLTATLTIDGGASTFDASGNVTVGETTSSSSSAGTLQGTLTVKGGATFTAGSNLILGNQASSAQTATRGTLSVSGANTKVSVAGNLVMGNRAAGNVTTTVNVSDGTLTVGGSLAEGTGTAANIASTVALSGGTLDMTHGTITVDTFTFTGGTLKNVATFTGGLNVQNTATLGFDLDGASPTLTLTGLTLGAGSNLGLSLLDDITPDASYTLVSGTISGTFLTVNGSAFGPGNTFTLSNNLGTYNGLLTYNANDITLAFSAIPEPSAFAALAGAAALGLVACRRRRVGTA